MPKEENSMEANKIKETLKDLEEQADHHAEIIQICDDDIEYWWDGLEVAWYQLQNDKNCVKGFKQCQPKDVIQTRQRLQCLDRWRKDEKVKLQQIKIKIELLAKDPQI